MSEDRSCIDVLAVAQKMNSHSIGAWPTTKRMMGRIVPQIYVKQRRTIRWLQLAAGTETDMVRDVPGDAYVLC